MRAGMAAASGAVDDDGEVSSLLLGGGNGLLIGVLQVDLDIGLAHGSVLVLFDPIVADGDRHLEGSGHPEEGRQGHDHREVRDQDLVDHRDRDR